MQSGHGAVIKRVAVAPTADAGDRILTIYNYSRLCALANYDMFSIFHRIAKKMQRIA
jgi:hypothetical protein